MNKLSGNYLIYMGLLSLIGYCISSAFSEVLISNLLVGVDLFLVCFNTFVLGLIVFILFNFINMQKLAKKVKQNLKAVVYLNITTFGSWFFLIYPLKYLEPSFVSTINFGAGPLIGLLIQKLFRNHSSKLFEYLIAITIFIILDYMIFIIIFRHINQQKVIEEVISVGCCFIVAASMIINRYNTKTLIINNFSALDILSLRFILLIMFTFVILFLKYQTHFLMLTDKRIIIASLGFVIIPLYLMQVSQKHLEPVTIAFIAPIMPIMIYFFEFKYSIQIVSKELFLPIIGILIAIIAGTYNRYLIEKSNIKPLQKNN